MPVRLGWQVTGVRAPGRPPRPAKRGDLSTRLMRRWAQGAARLHNAGGLRLAGRGLSDRENAEELVLSIRTVQSHPVSAYRKLGIASRSELKR
jgi:hypothetical protein